MAQKIRARMIYATITAVPATLPVALRIISMYGCPVGELMAASMLPARKSRVINLQNCWVRLVNSSVVQYSTKTYIKSPMVKFRAAAPTIQRASHLEASLSSSVK